MDGKKTSRKIQAAATREKIYDAAVHLVEEYGLENVSVDSIVEEAGISKGGFYVHFATKDALLTEMINGYIDKPGVTLLCRAKNLHRSADSASGAKLTIIFDFRQPESNRQAGPCDHPISFGGLLSKTPISYFYN